MTEEYIKSPISKASSMIRFFKIISVLTILTLSAATALYWHLSNLNLPGESFPVYQSIVIEQGTDVREITRILESEGVVQSGDLLYYAIAIFYEPTDLKASNYVFDQPITTYEVAKRLTEGDFDTDLIRLTHYEGERVTLFAERASKQLPNFNAEAFVLAAEPLEGRVFPDTYFVPLTFTDAELLELTLETFLSKTAGLEQQILEHPLTLSKILVLASIIEREANTMESKKLVSSVLQNRIEIGMALQADASVEYILDKPLNKLTPEDLKVDSPYNTYLNVGLPPTPIGNPGLDAIEAVLNPTESEYFYYITGNDGEFYYSATYAEHLRKINTYLR
ncbi:MAG: endolytic transglycosylase MltG [Candidatus Pacebacteria bacterium]|nr:endolytic transglycosylase MltG [Candidatus Paceibacterota bacterium]